MGIEIDTELKFSIYSKTAMGFELASSLLEERALGQGPLFPKQRLVEISGDNRAFKRTVAVSALLQAQQQGETSAWIQYDGGTLYPPDLHVSGVDFRGLAVVQIPQKESPFSLFKAAELLLRSGAMGLVVVDLGEAKLRNTDTAWQGRLLSLSREHHCTVVLMTDKTSKVGSLGPLISLRIEPQWHRVSRGRFAVEYVYLKNKIGAPEPPPQILRAPWGLR